MLVPQIAIVIIFAPLKPNDLEDADQVESITRRVYYPVRVSPNLSSMDFVTIDPSVYLSIYLSIINFAVHMFRQGYSSFFFYSGTALYTIVIHKL